MDIYSLSHTLLPCVLWTLLYNVNAQLPVRFGTLWPNELSVLSMLWPFQVDPATRLLQHNQTSLSHNKTVKYSCIYTRVIHICLPPVACTTLPLCFTCKLFICRCILNTNLFCLSIFIMLSTIWWPQFSSGRYYGKKNLNEALEIKIKFVKLFSQCSIPLLRISIKD